MEQLQLDLALVDPAIPGKRSKFSAAYTRVALTPDAGTSASPLTG
jgi:hypothetical protein